MDRPGTEHALSCGDLQGSYTKPCIRGASDEMLRSFIGRRSAV